MIYFQSLTQKELADLLLPLSQPRRKRGDSLEASPEVLEKRARYRARQIFHWVYQRFVTDWDQMTDLAKDLRVWLKENIEIYRLTECQSHQALDGTHKFLWKLADGKTIESVIIPAALQEKEDFEEKVDSEGNFENFENFESFESFESFENFKDEGSGKNNRTFVSKESKEPKESKDEKAFSGRPVDVDVRSGKWGRLTACISSQVGCAMACKFCLTGVQGLDRHLQTHEIVTQIFELRKLAPITNIVFMGMGEPLHNFDNVVKACQIFLDQDGFGFSKRKVTISTSGLVPAIEKLGKAIDVSLAISLNGSTDEQRSQIMPVNKKWNIEALLKACREYPLGSHRRITFEYVLLKDLNDSLEDAARVVQLTRGIPSKINLIPFNEHPASIYKRPSDETVRTFQKYLLDRNITATVRISRGRDILAACGQLRSIFGTARGSDRHKDFKSNELKI